MTNEKVEKTLENSSLCSAKPIGTPEVKQKSRWRPVCPPLTVNPTPDPGRRRSVKRRGGEDCGAHSRGRVWPTLSRKLEQSG